MQKLLDRINIVDADSRALDAQYCNIDGNAQGALTMVEVYASDQSLLRVGLERANAEHEDYRAGITELLAGHRCARPGVAPALGAGYLPMSMLTQEELLWRFGPVEAPEIEARRQRILDFLLETSPQKKQQLINKGEQEGRREGQQEVS